MANSIEHARKTGAIVASNGKSLIEFLDRWIKITDADEAKRAREALLGLQVQPHFTLVELEETYWWAEAIIQRLPDVERTAECNIRTRFLEGMKGALSTRKIAVESQLATLTALGHTIADASFIKMIGTQLAAHRIETGTVSAHSEIFEQPGIETKIKSNVNVTYHREQGDRVNLDGRRCFACNGNHLIDRCEKPSAVALEPEHGRTLADGLATRAVDRHRRRERDLRHEPKGPAQGEGQRGCDGGESASGLHEQRGQQPAYRK